MSETDPQDTMVLFDGDGRIASALFCHACGHDLRASPIDGRCAQCARPVTESLAGAMPMLDQTGCVATDAPCVSCGYNLRTRPVTSLCPECAAPVARSLRGHYLTHAPPRWARKIARGATLLLIATASMIVMPVLAAFGGMLTGLSGGPPIVFMIVVWAFGLAATVVLVWGLVYLTTPDPTMQFKREGLSARRLVRYCLLLLPLMIVGWIIAIAVRGIVFASLLSPLMAILSIGGAVAYLVIPLATLRHVAMLMRRVPRPGLVTFAKIEFWGLLITGGVYVLSVTVVIVLVFTTMTPAMMAAMGPNAPTAGPNPTVVGPIATAQPTKLGNPAPPGTPAALPNSPTTPTGGLTGAKASSSYQVDPNGRVTVTTVGPGGVTATTTMPATAPFPAGALPGPALMIGSLVMGAGGCGMFGFTVAGFILLILARNALAGAARQAENNALLISAAAGDALGE